VPLFPTSLPTSDGSLSAVLPTVAAALGAPVAGLALLPDPAQDAPAAPLPEASCAVVVLVDGLGELLLARRGGHAPTLRRIRAEPASRVVSCAFPSTTATSMGCVGTGVLPGTHGLVGLDVRDPARGVLFNELAWDPEVDARRWQPNPTVFEAVLGQGVEVVRVGPAFFDGSGLTEAVLRGGRFEAASSLDARVDAAVRAVQSARRRRARCLVFLYWGELDKTGHLHGCGSWQWGEELSAVDAAVRALARRLDDRTLVVVTADHGMVDVPMADRLDVATEPDLAAGVDLVGGEPRALHLYCRPGAVPDVVAAWRARLGDRMHVATREDVVAAGWFGPVAEHVLPRIGDVVVTADDSSDGAVAVVDSRTARPEVLRLLGLHGAATAAECLVPLLVTMGENRTAR